MEYGRDTYGFQQRMGATFVPGLADDYTAPPAPTLVAPEPQRFNPEMSNQIAGGIEAVKNLDLNAQGPRNSQYTNRSRPNDEPIFSPFPKLVNPPPNVPPSDAELEATLENARTLVLNSNDPEMQLAWAADALVYVGVCADNEERIAASKPHAARPTTPRIEHTLKVDSMNITNFLADQHHPKAEFLKGMWLEWGRFAQREDKKEAFRCYSRAADRGYARAEYRIGMLYESYNDPIKALRHYYKGVEAGDAASCYRLGMMTLRGQHGQQQDYAKAIDLIRRSANAADENAAQGAYVYGMLLARQLPQIDIPDRFLAYDEQQARINIEKAAYLKFAKAQLKMGSAYELASLGCEFNPALSMHYNALAAKQGEAEADMALSKWFLVGAEGVFPKNEELAFTYAERAAQSGLATAEFALGYFSEIGVYVPVDLDKAVEWYQKASKHGNTDATGRIEGLARKQALSRKDHEQVAVSRIKSQHGSMRGARPDRFRQQQQGQQMPQIPETPPANYGNGVISSQTGSSSVVPPPARGRTPYPEDNGPPIIPPLDNRPASVAPYPLEDGPPKPQLPPPAGGFFNVSQQQQQQQPPSSRPSTTINPDIRPSSAFQLNPEYRPNSVAAPQSTSNSQIPYAGGPPQYGGAKFRPATAQPADPRMRPAMGSRIASGPAGNGMPFQAQQQGGPPQMKPVPPLPVQQQQQQQLGPNGAKMDIGFSAPQDDGRRRQYGPSSSSGVGRPPLHSNTMPNPAGPPAASNGGSKPSPRLPVSAPAPQQPSAGRIPAPQQQQQPPPPRISSQTNSGPAGAGVPASKPTMTHTSTAPPPSKAGAGGGGGGKPGKGPKTFDEMGVPATKGDGDCVVM